MKSLKKTLSYLFMLAALVTSFAACSNDDDPETPAVNDISGTYNGYSEGKSTYFSGYMGTDETVTITAATDGTATVAYASNTWGSSSFSGITVTKGTDGYSLSGSGKFSMSGMGGTVKEYDCNVTGTISSDKKTYTVVFSLPSVMGGLTITFQNGEPTGAQLIAGTYSGWSQFAFSYTPTPLVYASEKTAITANEDGTVNITYTSDDLGTGTFSNVTVEKDGSAYKLTGSGTFSMSGMSGTVSNYDCNLSGTISADKETVNIVYSLPSVMGGSTITFQNGDAPVAQLLAGSYSGWSNGKSNYFSGYLGTDETVKITANEDGTVNLAYTSGTWGSTTIENLTATEADGGYSISGSGKFSMGMNGSAKEYDCNVTGTFSTDKATYTIEFSLPGVMGGLTITFQNGEAPAAKVLAGSYSGTANVTITGQDGMELPNQKITLTANEDGTLGLSYTNESLGSVVGTVTATKGSDGNYTISGTAKYQDSMDCEVSGTISSDKKTYTINVSVAGGYVTVVFKNA